MHDDESGENRIWERSGGETSKTNQSESVQGDGSERVRQWDREKESEKFFVLTGDGKVQCNVWDETKHTIKNVHEFVAHTGGCYTIAFDPSEKKTHFAIGSADSLVSI